MSGFPPLSLTDPLPFPKHRGKLVGTVIEEGDSEYIEWLIDAKGVKFLREVYDYLEEFK